MITLTRILKYDIMILCKQWISGKQHVLKKVTELHTQTQNPNYFILVAVNLVAQHIQDIIWRRNGNSPKSNSPTRSRSNSDSLIRWFVVKNHHATLPYERQSTFSFKSKIVFTFSIFHTYYNICYLPIPIYYLYNKSITAL